MSTIVTREKLAVLCAVALVVSALFAISIPSSRAQEVIEVTPEVVTTDVSSVAVADVSVDPVADAVVEPVASEPVPSTIEEAEPVAPVADAAVSESVIEPVVEEPAPVIDVATDSDATIAPDTSSDAPEITDPAADATTPPADMTRVTDTSATADAPADTSVAAVAEAPDPTSSPQAAPTLTTDQPDYAPGSIATIFGNFFQSLQNIVLHIFGDSEPAGDTADDYATVTTDESGSFTYQYQLDDVFRPLYTVVASALNPDGSTGEQLAQTTFTDAAVTDYTQCKNDDGPPNSAKNDNVADPCSWTNGGLNGTNAVLSEGDVVAHRLIHSGLTGGADHTLVFEFDFTKAGIHAYDFASNFNGPPQGDALLNACGDLAGANLTLCTNLFTPSGGAGNTLVSIPSDTNDGVSTREYPTTRNWKIACNPGPCTGPGGSGNPTISTGAAVGGSDSSKQITVVLHTPTNPSGVDVGLWMGMHLASAADPDGAGSAIGWGTGMGAASISGAPFHYQYKSLDGNSVGQRDNQISPGALVVPADSPTVATAIHNDGNHTTDVQNTTIALGSTIHDQATVTNAGPNGTPLGTATFQFFTDSTCTTLDSTSGALALSGGVVDATGFAKGPLAAGSYSFKASYTSSDTTKWNNAVGLCEPVTVGQGTSAVATTLHKADHTVLTEAGSVPASSVIHDLATVTPSGSFAPTGSVDFRFYATVAACTADTGFVDGTTKGSIALDGANPGAAHPSTDTGALTPGTYAFKAQWAGDSNYTGNTSACETFTVLKASPTLSTTIHDSSHNPVTSVALGSTVHDSATISGGSSPTGTVDFTFYTGTLACDNTGASAGAGISLVSGVAHPSDSEGPLAAGSYSFQAHYNGDSNNNAADSPCEPLTVNKSQLSLESKVHDASHTDKTNSSVPLGSVMHDTAKLSGGVVGSFTPPAITFKTYTNGTCTAGEASVANTGADENDATRDRSAASSALAAGAYAYKAFVAGDSNYLGADSGCEPFTVSKADTTTATEIHEGADHTTDVQNTSIPLGSSIHDSAAVSSLNVSFAIGGTVTYDYFANNSCGGTPTASETVAVGSESSSHDDLTAGDYSFLASYSGDANYNGSTATCEKVHVNKADLGISTTIHDSTHNATTTVALGSVVHDTATTTGQVDSIVPTGTVTFQFFSNGTCADTGSPVANTGADGSAVRSADSSALAAGSYSYQASVAGDANYNGATSLCEPLTVTKATPDVVTEVHNSTEGVVTSETLDNNVHDKATVSGIGGFTPTGNVDFTFYANGTCTTGSPAGNVPLDSGGVAHPSNTETLSGAGHYSFQAHYNGDTNYVAADSACEPFTYTTITVTKLANGGNDTFGYTVTGPTASTTSITTTGFPAVSTGSVTVPVLAGSYTVGETTIPANWQLVGLNCAGGQTTLGPTSPSFNVPAGTNQVCNFENTKNNATRTQGFWATHTAFANLKWESVLSTEKDVANWDGAGGNCSVSKIITNTTTPGSNSLMGGFWANIAKKSNGTKRDNLDKARMGLLQQLEAALLNKYGLGWNDAGAIATAKAAYCGTNVSAIRASTGALDAYNQVGDSFPITDTVPTATPKTSRAQANIGFWDNTTNN